MSAVGFTPLAPEHLELLHGWLQQPHVRAFWDDGHRTLEQVQQHYFEPDPDAVSFVFTLAGHPLGYLQAYRVDPESEYGPWRSPEGETWGIDLLLGAAADTGQGYGPRVIAAFLVFWKSARPELRRVLIDPDSRNIRAIGAYRKAGFSRVGVVSRPPATLQLLAADLSGM
ncbi:GNAT family N-acetyltransferase [Deinococcus radiomollis]|uniref:GNAT family N-acetyltransferase n=1 Tax=Deinococcus radiomollis TaxID=468916 RepID=UPI003891F88B